METLTHALTEEPVEVTVIEVTAGPDVGLKAQERRIFVGTSAECDLVLKDRSVSSVHCLFEISGDGRIRVTDLQSKNGTWLGRAKVRDVEISSSSEVRVGRTTLRAKTSEGSQFRAQWRGGDQLPSGALGKSAIMRRLFGQLARVAEGTDRDVLISGETGTGKELLARAVHMLSARHRGPFHVLDVGSLPRELVSASLFGHEEGAFSGAVESRPGPFERADGGTLFIDEIGELALADQPKLLRVLSEREVRRVGGTRARPVDVRVVAATHRPLTDWVREGTFRADLYHRLAVHELLVPPLRERRDDIAPLAAHFLERLRPDLAATVLNAFLEEHQDYAWPGNVRELAAKVERLVVLGEDAEPQRAQTFAEAKAQHVRQFERDYWSKLLAECDDNVSKTAKRAGVNRSHLSVRLRELGLR